MIKSVNTELPTGLTYEDLQWVPDDHQRYEVIDGELHVTPSPGYPHQRVIARLHRVLANNVEAHQLGESFTAGLMVVLDDRTGVEPDLVFVSRARMAAMRNDGFHGVPDLVVEVVSTKPMLDRRVKLEKYARSGIPHYWIADPSNRTFEAFRLAGGRYERVAELKDTGIFEPELFPGLQVDTADLWP